MLTVSRLPFLSERLGFNVTSWLDQKQKRHAIDYKKSESIIGHLPIRKWEKQLKTTGCDYEDYAILWQYVRKFQPQYFLELGPGVSTHVIAQAMKEFCYDKYEGKIKLVSIEEDSEWHKMVKANGPDVPFWEVHLSKVSSSNIFCFSGRYYEAIPYYPYNVTFVDGPHQKMQCTLDFFRILYSYNRGMTFLVDFRLYTMMAMFFMFGEKNISRLNERFFMVGPVKFLETDVNRKRGFFSAEKHEELNLRIWKMLDEKIPITNLLDAPLGAVQDESLKGDSNHDDPSKIPKGSNECRVGENPGSTPDTGPDVPPPIH